MPKLAETSRRQFTRGVQRFAAHRAIGDSAQVVDSAPVATGPAFTAIAFFATTF
jgi:hypothetical protein